jgi:hypothetical protein
MTIREEALQAMANDPEIALLYGAMSPGDRSVLAALLDCDGALGATTEDSPNARFWNLLSKYGWMVELEALLPESPLPILNYSITDQGYRAIPVLLGRLAPGEYEI